MTVYRNLIVTCVLASYLFSWSGLTVHHCCCTKSYHVSSTIADIFGRYVIHECEVYKESLKCDNTLRFKQWHHCGVWNYSMDSMKYSNQDSEHSPDFYADFICAIEPAAVFESADLFSQKSSCVDGLLHVKRRSDCTVDIFNLRI